MLEELEECLPGKDSPEDDLRRKEFRDGLNRFLGKLPEQERMRAIELLFSEHPQEAPVVEQGVFPQGSHPYVDALMFRGPNPLPYPDRPCTQLVGYKSKAPESYQEVRHDVVSHYRDYLVKQLVEQANQGNKVEN